MRADLGLPRFAQELFAGRAARKQLGSLAQALCFLSETFFQMIVSV